MSKTQAHIVADNYDAGRTTPTDAQVDRLLNDLNTTPAVADEDGERWDGQS